MNMLEAKLLEATVLLYLFSLCFDEKQIVYENIVGVGLGPISVIRLPGDVRPSPQQQATAVAASNSNSTVTTRRAAESCRDYLM